MKTVAIVVFGLLAFFLMAPFILLSRPDPKRDPNDWRGTF